MRNSTGAARQGRGYRGEGFTLVEVLITMLLLTITLVGLGALQIATIRNVTDSRLASQATRLAYSVVEQYQAESRTNLPTSTGGAWVLVRNANGAEMGSVGVDGVSTGPFTVHHLVEDVAASTERVISVRVTWLETSASGPGSAAATYRTRDVTLTIRRYL